MPNSWTGGYAIVPPTITRGRVSSQSPAQTPLHPAQMPPLGATVKVVEHRTGHERTGVVLAQVPPGRIMQGDCFFMLIQTSSDPNTHTEGGQWIRNTLWSLQQMGASLADKWEQQIPRSSPVVFVSPSNSSITVLSMPGAPSTPAKPKNKAEQRKAIKRKLAKVILPEIIKDDIVAQVIIHSERDRLFTDWGLGEVIEYGRATAMLFHGGPGTGKTFMAKAVADALGVPLISRMAGDMQSAMPGEYEQNLKELFEEASGNNGVIFFDECDGLLQSRQGMGQIMSAENNYLLQRIEEHEGIVIMATNRITTLDEALERRLSLIVGFPDPTPEIRKTIWENHLPKKLPLAKDVNVDTLAQFELTGGQIKNVVLNAARFALASDKELVDEECFTRAISRLLEGKKEFNADGERDFRVMHGSKVRTRGNK